MGHSGDYSFLITPWNAFLKQTFVSDRRKISFRSQNINRKRYIFDRKRCFGYRKRSFDTRSTPTPGVLIPSKLSL